MSLLMKILLIIYLSINFIVFLIYGIDKAKARRGSFRISEAALLFAAVLGAPGALLGMIVFHHKTRKAKFVVLVPLILDYSCISDISRQSRSLKLFRKKTCRKIRKIQLHHQRKFLGLRKNMYSSMQAVRRFRKGSMFRKAIQGLPLKATVCRNLSEIIR